MSRRRAQSQIVWELWTDRIVCRSQELFDEEEDFRRRTDRVVDRLGLHGSVSCPLSRLRSLYSRCSLISRFGDLHLWRTIGHAAVWRLADRFYSRSVGSTASLANRSRPLRPFPHTGLTLFIAGYGVGPSTCCSRVSAHANRRSPSRAARSVVVASSGNPSTRSQPRLPRHSRHFRPVPSPHDFAFVQLVSRKILELATRGIQADDVFSSGTLLAFRFLTGFFGSPW